MSARRRPRVREPQESLGSGPEMWERIMVPAIFVPWAERLVDATGVERGNRVLDIACATGTVARLVARRLAGTGHVTGVDLDEALLKVARRTSSREGTTIDWRRGDASSLPFSSGSFDVVLCQQGIQFFGDRKSAMNEMCRVLAPRGRFGANVCRSLDQAPGYRALATALGRHVGRKAEEMIHGVFSLGDPDVLRSLMEAAGFQRIDIRVDIGSAHFLSVEDFPRTYAVLMEAAPAATEALIHDVVQDLQEYCDADGLTFPIETLIATGQKRS